MATLIKAPKGTKDVVPSEVYKWQYVEKTLKECAENFGYSEIRFPVFEHTELFLRSIGDTTDVVQKEMYTFEDKGGRSITLRPEGTASTVRAFLENSLYMNALPFKAYYVVPNFRYERPQAGRLRQHHQFGVECFGASNPSTDAEIIALVDTFLKRLGITKISVHLNSIGCPVCRPSYHAKLKDYFESQKQELCETCHERFEKNPLRILDCKNPKCSEIAEKAPKTIEHLCEDCDGHFSEVKNYLSILNIPFEIDSSIVRGLDYYTKTVFEFVSTDIGAQGTICGGGRYDTLIEQVGGPKTPGMGFGCGLERLIMVMEALNCDFGEQRKIDLYIAPLGENADKFSQRLVHDLRLKGLRVERDLMSRALRAQMKYADKVCAKYTLVLGDSEIENKRIKIKNMITGEEKETSLEVSDIYTHITE